MNPDEIPLPERPLECSECQKPINTHYSVIAHGVCTQTGMCHECPQLQQKLHGMANVEDFSTKTDRTGAGLVCGECGTTLDNVRVGHVVGCAHCYKVFSHIIVDELVKMRRISPQALKVKKGSPFHLGRSPGEKQEINPSLQLIALNEALEETLKHEEYEKAAWLRDQIKMLTENSENNDEKK